MIKKNTTKTLFHKNYSPISLEKIKLKGVRH